MDDKRKGEKEKEIACHWHKGFSCHKSMENPQISSRDPI
jgi:hypothetical protein